MARFVRFGGTVDDYVSVDDINQMGGSDAHMYQSLGGWVGIGGTLAQVNVAAAFSGKGAELPATTNNVNFFLPVESFQMFPSVPQTVSVWLNPDVDARTYMTINYYDSGGGLLGTDPVEGNTDPLVPGVRQQITTTVTPPALTVSGNMQVFYRTGASGNPVTGTSVVMDSVCVRLGADPTFRPSLRISGTLFETKNPLDLPIVFDADGTPLTVGRSWVGDGYTYLRFDGPDLSALLVAEFDAEDIGL